jgi:hypothetical protein
LNISRLLLDSIFVILKKKLFTSERLYINQTHLIVNGLYSTQEQGNSVGRLSRSFKRRVSEGFLLLVADARKAGERNDGVKARLKVLVGELKYV